MNVCNGSRLCQNARINELQSRYAEQVGIVEIGVCYATLEQSKATGPM